MARLLGPGTASHFAYWHGQKHMRSCGCGRSKSTGKKKKRKKKGGYCHCQHHSLQRLCLLSIYRTYEETSEPTIWKLRLELAIFSQYGNSQLFDERLYQGY